MVLHGKKEDGGHSEVVDVKIVEFMDEMKCFQLHYFSKIGRAHV